MADGAGKLLRALGLKTASCLQRACPKARTSDFGPPRTLLRSGPTLKRRGLEASFRLHAFHIRHQVGDSLLYLSFVALANAGEQRSPDRHVLAAVGRRKGLSLEHG